MGFLVLTCIKPISLFLGCIPLTWSLIVMAGVIVVIAGYTYQEASIYFSDFKIFGVINRTFYLIIELAVALLVFVNFLAKKKSYSLIVYFLTLAYAGFGLAVNFYKLSVYELEKVIEKSEERKFIQWLFFIRIGAEFIAEMMVCYVVYSLKCSL